MVRKILVIFDTLAIRKEVVRYAMGLAKRTESELMLLAILHSNSFSALSLEGSLPKEEELEKAVKESLAPYLLEVEQEGIKVSAEVTIGDPPSEFLKFMAKNHSFQAIVWGGAENIIKPKSTKMEGHWLGQVKNLIDCPLVVPSHKLIT